MTMQSSFIRFWEAASLPILEDRLMILLMAIMLNMLFMPRRAYIDTPRALIPGHWLTRYLQASERKLNRVNRSVNARFVRGLLVLLPPVIVGWAAGARLAEWSLLIKYGWVMVTIALAAMMHARVYYDVAQRILSMNHDM